MTSGPMTEKQMDAVWDYDLDLSKKARPIQELQKQGLMLLGHAWLDSKSQEHPSWVNC